MKTLTTPTLLLVEDEPDSVTLFEYAVSKLPAVCALATARTGVDAIAYLDGVGPFADRQLHPFPGLVLLDLKMPLSTGFEVLRHIRQSPTARRVVVVVFTASASAADVAEAYDAGANAYVVKPSTLDELVELVRSISSFWLDYNRVPREVRLPL